MPAYQLELIVVCLGLVMLLVEAFVQLGDKRKLAWLGVLGLGVVFCLLFVVEPHEGADESVIWTLYTDDSRALFFKGLALLTTIFVLIISVDYTTVLRKFMPPAEKGAHPQSGIGEFFCLPVFACAGMMWMASANNLVSIFVSLEAVTITFYVLVAYMRRNAGSLEAGVKYLILGALSTGFLVYGFAWLFGITGSMELSVITEKLAADDLNVTAALFAFALILIAMGFKVGAAPFQIWVPDVYQGAPTPVTAFLSVGSKAAGFVVLLRLAEPFLLSPYLADKAILTFSVIAGITLIFGNAVAIPQENFKRLLAYSSIAHVGFLMMALASAPEVDAVGSAVGPGNTIAFYLAAYLCMTLLAFAVVAEIRTRHQSEDIIVYRGLAKTSPFLAFALLISMTSLAGVPLTAGFFGKFFVFSLAIQQQQWLLVGIAVAGAAAGFYYYLKVVAAMYFQDPLDPEDTIPVSAGVKAAMIVLILAILFFGIFPGTLLALL